MLEQNWEAIRDEGLANMEDTVKGAFRLEEERLREKGTWKQFTLYQQGTCISGHCQSLTTINIEKHLFIRTTLSRFPEIYTQYYSDCTCMIVYNDHILLIARVVSVYRIYWGELFFHREYFLYALLVSRAIYLNSKIGAVML